MPVGIVRNPEPEDVRQSAGHTLFVEGKDRNALDPDVLRTLLADMSVRVEPMGGSLSIRSVAEALHPYHEKYYFLIDRDHHNSATVESSWRNFPDPTASNLLIWRKRHLESYFLAPEYLARSSYLTCSAAELANRIIRIAQERVFIDAANIVIIEAREALKVTWIECFTDPHSFVTREVAKDMLRKAPQFEAKKRSVSQLLRLDRLLARLDEVIDEISGGMPQLQIGNGTWLERLDAKKLLPIIINSNCFRVQDTACRAVNQKDKLRQVAKELLSQPLAEQPGDFQQLHSVISGQVGRS